MTTIDFHDRRAARPQPLRIRDASEFDGREVPKRDWLIPDFLVRGSVTMLNGAGGVGKSLLCLQLQVAAALGQPWLGMQLPGPMASFGFYCEDDEDEIHRRLADICAHYKCSFADLRERVRFVSRVGEQNELMTFKYRGDDMGVTTPLYAQLRHDVELYRSKIIIIDTVADTFGGNENIRPQARAFIGRIRQLSLINLGGVILAAHPSRAGMADGSGFSGSTAWEGSVRQRIYFTKPRSPDQDVDGEDEPTDDRIIKTMKANYGPAGDKVRVRWQKGVFVRTDLFGPNFNESLEHNKKILAAASYLVEQGAMLAADPQASSSLTVKAIKLPTCKGISWKDALAAQDRLLADGRLVLVELGPPSKRRKYIRPEHLRFPGEAGATGALL